jgi:hypothetical protein
VGVHFRRGVVPEGEPAHNPVGSPGSGPR